MFHNLHALLRTLLLLAFVSIAGWWTLWTREKLSDRSAELAQARDEAAQLAATVERKDERIAELGTAIAKKDAEIGDLRETVKAKDEEIQTLGVALDLLKVSRRIARFRVLSQEDTPEGTLTRIEFTELGPDGDPIGNTRTITVHGSKVYLETWVVKFDDAFVEEGDPLRGTSICLFRRVFGEDDKPTDGTELDPVGEQPLVYAGERAPDPLHQDIWRRFWDLANDPDAASAMGLRAVHGEAPFIDARPGKTYRVELRASDGLTIRVES
ncbi:MAG TPA: hypothetical protein ENJ09_06085 [Planctomycetes bacterium]|nr:hypothetical protein [Planctomycetota bacterium]